MLESFHVFNLNIKSLFLSSFNAGLEIGFSFLLLATLFHLLIGTVLQPFSYRLFALVYPVGFVLVILGRSILFTEQTSLLTLPVLNGNQSLTDLLKLWAIVIFGNVIGGSIFALITYFLAPQLNMFTVEDMAHIGEHIIDYPNHILFFSAVIAGWLMGLLSWVLNATDNTFSKIVLVYIITGTIGFLGLHHSIVGNVEMVSGLLASEEIQVINYLTFLGLTLAGNAIGGATLVALFKYRAFVSNYDG